jgi:hypothetical protein
MKWVGEALMAGVLPVTFVVLVTLRFASLVLGNAKPETKRAQRKKVTLMFTQSRYCPWRLRRRGRSARACWLACRSSPEPMTETEVSLSAA